MSETTTQEIRTNTDLEPYKVDTFATYCLWKSLPSFFKFPPKRKDGTRATPTEFVEDMGVDDPKIIDLCEITSQKAFAERFKVDMDTLTRWNKTQEVRDSLEDIRGWARGLSKNVLMALYNTAIRKGFAIEAKLWFQLIEKWEEKLQVAHDHRGIAEFNIIRIVKNGNDNTGQTENKLGTDGKTS